MRRTTSVGATVAALLWMVTASHGGGPDPKQTRDQAPGDSPCSSHSRVPESNRTVLGLYVSPQEAYDMWRADPGAVLMLDVRTFEEYLFVGHAEGAKNVPIVFPRYNPAGAGPGGAAGLSNEPNPDFLAQVKQAAGPDATILVICASGGRAAMAVNQLAKAGFAKVYNVVNGLEGDKVDDPASAFFGKKLKNGWKNCGLPWTYDLDPRLVWVAPGKTSGQ